MTTGVCPFAVWRPTKNFGYGKGRHDQNRPLFFVDHIMAGYKSTMDNTAWLDNSGISAHFGIGLDGSISQYVNILDASYANGVCGANGLDRYDRSNRHLALLEDEGWWQPVTLNGVPYLNLQDSQDGAIVSLLNARSVTFEHEGLDGAKPWTQAMLDADIRVKQWCLTEMADAGVPMTVGPDVLVGHFQIDPVNRPGCPGAAWPKAQILAELETAQGEEGIMIVANGRAAYFEGRQFHEAVDKAPFWVGRDYKLPAKSKMARLEVQLTTGAIVFNHGTDKNLYAYSLNTQEERHAFFDVALDDIGDCFFSCAPGTIVEFIGLLGYWPG